MAVHQTDTQKAIRSMRERRGWSQRELAARMGKLGGTMHSTAVAKIESGDRNVTVEELLLIAAALDVSPTSLLLPVDGGQMTVTPKVRLPQSEAWAWLAGVRVPNTSRAAKGRRYWNGDNLEAAEYRALRDWSDSVGSGVDQGMKRIEGLRAMLDAAFSFAHAALMHRVAEDQDNERATTRWGDEAAEHASALVLELDRLLYRIKGRSLRDVSPIVGVGELADKIAQAQGAEQEVD